MVAEKHQKTYWIMTLQVRWKHLSGLFGAVRPCYKGEFWGNLEKCPPPHLQIHVLEHLQRNFESPFVLFNQCKNSVCTPSTVFVGLFLKPSLMTSIDSCVFWTQCHPCYGVSMFSLCLSGTLNTDAKPHINNPVPSLFLSKTDQNIPEGISSDIFNNDFLTRDTGKKKKLLQSSQSASELQTGLLLSLWGLLQFCAPNS